MFSSWPRLCVGVGVPKEGGGGGAEASARSQRSIFDQGVVHLGVTINRTPTLIASCVPAAVPYTFVATDLELQCSYYTITEAYKE